MGFPWSNAYTVKRWIRSLQLTSHHEAFQSIYQHVDGFTLSRLARAHEDAMEYTYGEIEFMSFIALISLAHPSHQTRFYDLGSGTGKAVLACAMVFDMQECCGIEYFKTLHDAAELQQRCMQQLPAYQKKSKTIRLIQGNFLNIDLSHASLIFINATALWGITWERLNQQLTTEAAEGTIIITTSKPLIASNAFIIIRTTQVLMSWGIVTAYIHSSV